MAANNFSDAALLMQTETEYGVRRIVGHFVHPQDTGELHNLRWDSFSAPQHLRPLADLTIHAYVGGSSVVSEPDGGHIWGHGTSYQQVYEVAKADHAQAMAKVLTRIERGLNRLNDRYGYVADDDFHGYTMRVISTLGVAQIYVRQFRQAEQRSGNRYRKVDATALQWYIGSVSNHAKTREFAELNERN